MCQPIQNDPGLGIHQKSCLFSLEALQYASKRQGNWLRYGECLDQLNYMESELTVCCGIENNEASVYHDLPAVGCFILDSIRMPAYAVRLFEEMYLMICRL